MKQTAYGTPLFLKTSGEKTEVVELMKLEPDSEFMIQKLVFEFPDCLPISEIDEAYNPLVPVCMELSTGVGPLDILLVSPDGQICIIETKLWRNPESRRKVVAQILDYAKELAGWTYSDLQREINRRLARKGNSLYHISRDRWPDRTLPEADFVDAVSRNLARGKFLLLVVGDGIREGMLGIRDFMAQAGNLMFTLGMVELSLYERQGLGTIVIPKILMKTVEIPRLIVEVPEGLQLVVSEEINEKTTSAANRHTEDKEKTFYIEFWAELLSELEFDDPGQPMPNPATAQNLYLYPASTKRAWISAYFAKSKNRAGVYFRTQNNQEGQAILEYLRTYRDRIETELGPEAIPRWNITDVAVVHLPCDDLFAEANRDRIKDFFKEWLNQFVNTFRPLLQRMDE